MADIGELARPYAIAAFQQAQEESKLAEWGENVANANTDCNRPHHGRAHCES